MYGRLFVVGLTLAACGGPAAADGLRLSLELEGTLTATPGGGYAVAVEGEGTWRVDLSDGDRKAVGDLLARRPNAKVQVTGSVAVTTVRPSPGFPGAALAVTQRVVRASSVRPMVPGVRVNTVQPGSPAAGRFQEGDILREVEGRELSSYQSLLDVLSGHRGKMVNVVVVRDNVARVEAVKLRETGVPLGITGETVWTPYEGGTAPTKVPEPAPPPAAKTPEPKS